MERIKTASSAEANADIEKPYRAAVKKAIDAAVAQSKAFADARQLVDDFIDAGFFFHQPQLALLGRFGRWDDPDAHIHTLLQDAEREGLIAAKDYPRPKQHGPYDNLPKGHNVTTLAAGPSGIRKVEIARGGKIVKEEIIHRPNDEAMAEGWG
ncbi:hypothetical protein [Thiohalobacter thiocyanaticus]|uniref:hypothetical protein n=1 Tax=Thiohalobacter thiocyanaticus TaxID=585455 RepID=UPI001319DE24|nr:hypothetical protein [Thiohalobacter thiocyanaticus]